MDCRDSPRAVDQNLRGPAGAARPSGGFPLVVLASALWGTDALFRRGLALDLPATIVVVWEHGILTVLVLPVLLRLPWRRLDRRDWSSLLLIGGGASALATMLFTAAFSYGDPNTPLLLQKLQPFVAVLGARWLLGEELRPRFGWWLAAAIGSGWLVTFADPLDISVEAATPGVLAAMAAALWAMGTVLGRRMSGRLTSTELTAARFGIGLPFALLFSAVGPGRAGTLAIEPADVLPLVPLALLPGLLALKLYYRGLSGTPAAAATLAELAFPVSALLINWVAFGATLTWTQTLGVVCLSGVLVAMSRAARSPRQRLGIVVKPQADDLGGRR